LKLSAHSIFLGFCIVIIYFCLNGCSKDIHDHPEQIAGKQLFELHCSSCHKVTGKGKFLKGVPANKDTLLTKSQIEHKIRDKSSANGKMPSFPEMSAGEAAKISAYLKSI